MRKFKLRKFQANTPELALRPHMQNCIHSSNRRTKSAFRTNTSSTDNSIPG
jgi:hypothetical protein